MLITCFNVQKDCILCTCVHGFWVYQLLIFGFGDFARCPPLCKAASHSAAHLRSCDHWDETHSGSRNVVGKFILHTVQNHQNQKTVFIPRWKSKIKSISVFPKIIDQLTCVVKMQCVFCEADNGLLCVWLALRSRNEHYSNRTRGRMRAFLRVLWEHVVPASCI